MPLAAILQNLILVSTVEAVVPARPFVAVPPALTSNIKVLYDEVTFVWQVVDPALVSKTVNWGVDTPVGVSIHMAWETVVSGGVRVDVSWDTGWVRTVARSVVWDTGWMRQVSRAVWVGSIAERVALLVVLELV